MLKETVSVTEVLEFLNAALRIDRAAVSGLIETRVPCNSEMADHPTIQVQAKPGGLEPKVGFLGFLNGLFGSDEEGWGVISIEVADDGRILQFFRTPTPLERQWGKVNGRL